jgi:hypothetical protein
MARALGIRLLAAAVLILCAMPVLCVAQPETARQAPTEYQVKAAFLYNFAKFVEWPPEPNEQKAPLAICVFGRDPFDGALERVTQGKTIDGRRIVIRRTRDIAIARSCQILFVSLSEAGRMAELFEALRDTSILSVSEIPRFCRAGGVIAFEMEGQRVRFRVNVNAASRVRLKISSKLLQLAVTAPEAGEDH